MQHLFQAERDFAVRACCTHDEEVLPAVIDHQPDVLVLDPHLPGRGALALLRSLAARHLTLRVVLLATTLTKRHVAEAVRLGVRGVVLKEMPSDLLVECVRRVHQGETWLETGASADLVGRLVERDTGRRSLARRLTPRELEVLRLRGRAAESDITTRLDITEGTVKVHLHSIYEKLKIRTACSWRSARDAGPCELPERRSSRARSVSRCPFACSAAPRRKHLDGRDHAQPPAGRGCSFSAHDHWPSELQWNSFLACPWRARRRPRLPT
jgi:DNA-binding NarL/FixJ family response regulator